jgi:hypothetical protein
MTLAIGLLLALLAACCWVAAAALWRLPRGMDRLHVVSFVSLATSPLLVAVTAMQTGMAVVTAKVAFLWLINALVGVGVAHALGRLMRPGEGGDA